MSSPALTSRAPGGPLPPGTNTGPITAIRASIAGLPQSLFARLPPSVATRRLKVNVFSLIIFTFVCTLFTPYVSVREWAIRLSDEVQGRRGAQVSYGDQIIWGIQYFVLAIFAFNAFEAYNSIRNPAPMATVPLSYGQLMTPIRRSSPLTRAYPSPTPHRSSPLANNSTTSTSNPSSKSNTAPAPSSFRAQAYSTPTRPSGTGGAVTPGTIPNAATSLSTPLRSSPLSNSTSKALNLTYRPRESTGLFYGSDANSSPSKVAQTQLNRSLGKAPSQEEEQNQGRTTRPAQGAGAEGDYVMVEREEKEWAENVWKGVKGRSGRAA